MGRWAGRNFLGILIWILKSESITIRPIWLCEDDVKQIESEAGLREWLRRSWLADLWGPLIWVEAARGGTVGAPDVLVPVPGSGFVPVELKFWPRRDNKEQPWRAPIPVHMRPAQRRLHSLIGASGHRSVVLAYVGFGEIGIVEGWRIARDLNPALIHRRNLDVNEFRNLLLLALFWKDENYATMARTANPQQLRKVNRKRVGRSKGL